MSADGKLFDIEDSLKQKHLGLVKQMSYYELKRFSVRNSSNKISLVN